MIASLVLAAMVAPRSPTLSAPAQHVPRTSTICRNLKRKRCWRVPLVEDCRDAEAFRTVVDDSARTDVNVALADCEASLSDHEPTAR